MPSQTLVIFPLLFSSERKANVVNTLANNAEPHDWLAESEDRRFRRILIVVIMVFTAVSIAIPYLPVFKVEREKEIKLPPRVAKVLIEKKKIKKAPKPKEVIKKPKTEKKKPTKTPVVKPKKKVKKQTKPKVKKQTAKQRVLKKGLLAMSSELNALREDKVFQRLSNPNRKLIKGAKNSSKNTRASVVKNVSQGSGGIDSSKMLAKTSQTDLAQRETTKVESTLAAAAGDKREGKDYVNSRTIEEIRLVLERHKGSFTTLYNRQLRRSPGLKGTVLFEIKIAPSGEVLSCKIIQSELQSPKLERKFVTKLKSLSFGAKDVETTIIEYPLDFFPS